MFDKGLEKLGFIQSSVGGFNVQILNQTKIALLPYPEPRTKRFAPSLDLFEI